MNTTIKFKNDWAAHVFDKISRNLKYTSQLKTIKNNPIDGMVSM